MHTITRFAKKSCFIAATFAVVSLLSNPSFAEKTLGKPGSLQINATEVIYYAADRDTLSSIAKQLTDKAMNWEVIGKRNKITNDRTIPVGSAIVIPVEILPEEASQASVAAIAGVVTELKKDGAERILALGDLVLEGSQINTGKNGFISLALPDESRVSIPSNSQVALAKLRMTKYTKSPRTEIKLVQGRVESKVTPLTANKGRFEVTSPLAIAGVRGTHFRVGVSDNGIANEVLSGGVSVGKKENPNALLLPAGEGNIINSNGVGKAIPLLSAPTLVDNYQTQDRQTVQFALNSLPDAAAYRAQISTDVLAQNIVAEGLAKERRFKFDKLDDGDYFVRLTAIDANGLEGIPSIKPFKLKANPAPPFPLQPKFKLRAETLAFKWTQTKDAKYYRLQVATDEQFAQVVLDQDRIIDVEFSTAKLALGNYFWRVATIAEKNGLADQGPFSSAQSFSLMATQGLNPFNDNGENNISFSWPSEVGQHFLVQIAKDITFKNIFLSKETDRPNLDLPRPEAGTYYIRVQATDADRFVGQFSQPQKFEIRLRWTTGTGEPLNSIGGTVRPIQ